MAVVVPWREKIMSLFPETTSFRLIIIIFLVALGTRLFLFGFLIERFGVNPGLYWIDADQYTTLAKNLVAGNGFSLSDHAPYLPDTLRTPGYPLYLALCYILFGNVWSAALLQVVMSALIPLAVFWLALKLTRDSAIGFLAGIVTAIEPHLLIFTISIDTEGIFTPLFMAIIILAYLFFEQPSVSKAILIGALSGYAALTRPVFLYALPLIFIFLLLPFSAKDIKKKFVAAVCFLLISLAFVVPWMYRNEERTGVFTFATIGWVNVYTRLAVTVYAVAHHQTFDATYKSFLSGLRDEGIINDPAEHELYHARYIPLLQERSFAILKQYPRETFLLQLVSIQTLFTQDNLLFFLPHMKLIDYPARPPVPLSLLLLQKGWSAWKDMIPYMHGSYLLPYLMRTLWLFFWVMSVVGAWFLLRTGNSRERIIIWSMIVMILFFVFMTLPVAASISARYRVVFEPLYFILVATGLVISWQRAGALFDKKV